MSGPIGKVATIRDVAQFAGVSVATVSRVVNSTCVVRKQTSDAVFEAAKQLGFRPNLMGRNLRATRTKTIGVMLPMLSHPVFAECLQGIETAAQDHNHVVAVSSSGYRPESDERSSEVLLQQRVAGLILTVADATSSPVLDKLDAEGIPYVLVFNQVEPGASSSKFARPSVCVDNHIASRDMVNYLIELGHDTIHMVAGQFRQSDRSCRVYPCSRRPSCPVVRRSDGSRTPGLRCAAPGSDRSRSRRFQSGDQRRVPVPSSRNRARRGFGRIFQGV